MSERNTINIGRQAFEDEREPVLVPRGDGTLLTLHVRKLGYLEMTDLQLRARAQAMSPLTLLVAQAVEDEDGHRFTVEEVGRLRKDVAEPLTAAAIRINKVGETKAEEGADPN